MKSKKASIIHEMIIHLVLIILILGLFYAIVARMVDTNIVKQQVVEKQLALLVDSAMPGMNISVSKLNVNGRIRKMEIKQDRIFVYVDDLLYSEGYEFFTKYSVKLSEDENKFYIQVYEEK